MITSKGDLVFYLMRFQPLNNGIDVEFNGCARTPLCQFALTRGLVWIVLYAICARFTIIVVLETLVNITIVFFDR